MMGISSILEEYISNPQNARFVFLTVKPLNISVLSDDIVTSKIRGFTNTLKTVEYIEILCINSSQSYEKNKEFLKKRLGEETRPAIRDLLMRDIQFLDRIRLDMSTSREFLLCLKFPQNIGTDEMSMTVKRAIQTATDGGLTASLTEKKELKRLISIYYEQNVFDEITPDFEGGQYCGVMQDES